MKFNYLYFLIIQLFFVSTAAQSKCYLMGIWIIRLEQIFLLIYSVKYIFTKKSTVMNYKEYNKTNN